ncbi:MAG: RNA polymerase sporulation sigma factor SigK [Oliverpabstia sp.]|nr:RNA polymerase sporulation sigma factor SigK [Eubacterium sp.]MCI6995291.1 RNA polymerase sporulation sigma factor SigK [Eubacterium sp.]MDY2595119.1 RNA polymerase sporulation sigma factor SigK [Oliverpabstia sp.]
MKTFQKPLTMEEEKIHLLKYSQGNMESRDVLIERNLRLVAHIIKKYQGLDEDPDDLISIGTIGLIKAISTYDMSKGSRLATYAARCIDNELLMMLRNRKKKSREVSLYEPIGTDKEGNEIHLMDIVEGNDTDITSACIHKENVQRLYQLLEEALTPLEYDVIRYRYGLFGEPELTQQVIAKRLNISRSYVSRIEKSAILKLRDRFFST